MHFLNHWYLIYKQFVGSSSVKTRPDYIFVCYAHFNGINKT